MALWPTIINQLFIKHLSCTKHSAKVTILQARNIYHWLNIEKVQGYTQDLSSCFTSLRWEDHPSKTIWQKLYQIFVAWKSKSDNLVFWQIQWSKRGSGCGILQCAQDLELKNWIQTSAQVLTTYGTSGNSLNLSTSVSSSTKWGSWTRQLNPSLDLHLWSYDQIQFKKGNLWTPMYWLEHYLWRREDLSSSPVS